MMAWQMWHPAIRAAASSTRLRWLNSGCATYTCWRIVGTNDGPAGRGTQPPVPPCGYRQYHQVRDCPMRGDGPRKQNLVNIGHAARPDNGRVRLPKEVARVGQEHVGSTQPASGFAMTDDGIDLRLMPRQPPREGRA
jgi:hypothetical protein